MSGLDAAPALIEIAKGRVPEGEFEVGDLQFLPYPDDRFDVVTGFNGFQYAADPVAALSPAGGEVGLAGARAAGVALRALLQPRVHDDSVTPLNGDALVEQLVKG